MGGGTVLGGSSTVAGYGLGLRAAHFQEILAERASPLAVDWFEIVSENYLGVGGRARHFLTQVRARYPVCMHGVGLSIGSQEPLPWDYLGKLKELAAWLSPPVISDHLSWSRWQGANSHDLLPMPYTTEVLNHLVLRLEAVQTFLGRAIALENPSAYVAFAGSTWGEAEFLSELSRRSGCAVLLDINNLFINACNLGISAPQYLRCLTRVPIAYMHLAGHTVRPDIRIDTHDAAVIPEVWALYGEARRLFPTTPVMVEWDGDVPPLATVLAQLEIARAQDQGGLDAGDLREGAGEIVLAAPLRVSRAGDVQARPWADVQKSFWSMVTAQDDVDPTHSAFEILQPAPDGAPALVGINVYMHAYYLRLCDVAASQFQSLVRILGREAFDDLVRSYLRQSPPVHVSVKYAAAGLPQFISKWTLPPTLKVAHQVLVDLARLEWALEDLYDYPDGGAPLPLRTLAEVREKDWEGLRVDLIPAAHLLSCSYAVGPVVSAILLDQEPGIPPAKDCHYLVHRRVFDVEFEEVTAVEAAAWSALRSGAVFAKACAEAATAAGALDESSAAINADVVASVVRALGRWFELGLVQGLKLDT